MRLFSTEQVSKYHPDKYADQISDAILDECLKQDEHSRVACEALVKDTTVVLAGEITTAAKIDYEATVKRVADKLGYKVDKIINLVGKQSQEIADAVNSEEEIGAGDQGMMVGYATRETESRLPYGFDLANRLIKVIEKDVETNPQTILKGDAKVQVTADLDAPKDERSIKTILVSVCHKPASLDTVHNYVKMLVNTQVIELHEGINLIVNPAGTWTVGGPTADAGLTGRKIVCDQYGGYVPVGGGAFSGKDPTKVDRSGAYAARQLAVEILNNHPKLNTVEVQLAYAIGKAEPVSINIKTDDPEMSRKLTKQINYKNFTPKAIMEKLGLKKISYESLAEGCHYYSNDR